MQASERKAAVAAWKRRKSVPGIYAVRCVATGELWVGRAPDLTSIEKRLCFTLRQGSNPHRSLQAAWAAHGADAFTWEELERIEDEEMSPALRDLRLKDRLASWQERLGARAI